MRSSCLCKICRNCWCQTSLVSSICWFIMAIVIIIIRQFRLLVRHNDNHSSATKYRICLSVVFYESCRVCSYCYSCCLSVVFFKKNAGTVRRCFERHCGWKIKSLDHNWQVFTYHVNSCYRVFHYSEWVTGVKLGFWGGAWLCRIGNCQLCRGS